MNPYNPFFMPRSPVPPIVMTVDHANAVIAQFQSEETNAVAGRNAAQEELTAIQDVLGQVHPDLSPDLEKLSSAAQLVGEWDGFKTALSTMHGQFIAALPYDIRQKIQKPVQTSPKT